jgi:hypothetical protein
MLANEGMSDRMGDSKPFWTRSFRGIGRMVNWLLMEEVGRLVVLRKRKRKEGIRSSFGEGSWGRISRVLRICALSPFEVTVLSLQKAPSESKI